MKAQDRPAGPLVIGIVAATFAVTMASTTVITPLYPGYVAEFGISSLEVTIVFAAYGAAVMVGLALFGRLSDHYGRKPPLGAALCVAIASMVVFLLAQDLGALLLGRVLIGLTAGVYTGTCTAWLVDLCPDRVLAAKIAIAANLGGLGLGPLLGGVLAQWAPRPLRLVYAVELGLIALGLIAHRWMPETVRRERFDLDLGDLRPPPSVRAVFLPAAVAAIAAFGVFGVFGAVGPAMLRSVFDVQDPVWAGLLVGAAFTCAVIGQLVARRFDAAAALAAGCAGLAVSVCLLALALKAELLVALVVAAVASGISTGVIMGAGLGLLTSTAPPEHRGLVASSYFLAAYIGLVVPVVGFGLVEQSIGLVDTGLVFSAVIGIAVIASGLAVRRPVRSPA
jgi:MFS family permease